jgi:lipopolysaccharide/colanic/teichoic acid biosynthesis glycosyltransferase/uridine kinase
MNSTHRYLICITGPLLSRDQEVAEELAQRLEKGKVVACHTLFPQAKTLPDLQHLTIEEIGTILDEFPQEYIIVYGDNILALESMRKLASLRIYVDANELDIASDVLQKVKISNKKENLRGESLSVNVQKILQENSEHIEEEVSSTKKFADIVIDANEEPKEAVFSVERYVLRTDTRKSPKQMSGDERKKRIDEMMRQYRNPSSQTRRAKLKKRLWTLVIQATLVLKRLLDILVTLVALLLLSPLLGIVSLIIKLTDGGPVFYVQTRIGKQGKPFPFPKFRSMVINADKLKDNLLNEADRKGDVTFKMKKDPRVTAIGRFIRRFSIDELPQLWCVLIGDMSIVGPRPPVPREVALYTQEDRRRLEVTPGLTGIWQVSGRSEIGFKQQVELDVLYIESHGFLLDIKLILKTIPAVLTGKGAY